MASKSVEPTRALVSGRQSLGRERRWLQQKARKGPGGIRRTSARTAASHCSPLSLRFQTAAAASRLSPHDVQGALGFRNDRALPRGLRTTRQSQPSSRARRVLEKSTVNSDPPEVAPARYSLSKSSGKETATDAAQRLLNRDRRQSGRFRRDDQSGAHHRRNSAQNARSQIYAGSQSGSLLSRVALGTTIQEGKSACCTWQRSAWIVQFMR